VKAATVMLSLVVGLRKWFRWPVTLEKTKEEIPRPKELSGNNPEAAHGRGRA